MVSEQSSKRRKGATNSDIASASNAVLVHVQDQGGPGERNRTGETSGAKDETECHGQDARRRAARDLGEVDELFSKLRKKVKAMRAQPSKVTESKQAGRKKRKVAGNREDIFGEGTGRPYRMGADGLRIFTEEELKVGQGGSTDSCPFDCQCCF